MTIQTWTKGILIAIAFSGCASEAEPKDTATMTGVDDELGLTIYQTNCQVCHGINGEGGAGSILNDGRLASTSVADIETIVRDGTDDMPGFGSRLSADEISAVAQYVLTTFGGS
jgi:mono/diheme cytochrome c family protein